MYNHTPPPPTLVYIIVDWMNNVPAMCLLPVRMAALSHYKLFYSELWAEEGEGAYPEEEKERWREWLDFDPEEGEDNETRDGSIVQI